MTDEALAAAGADLVDQLHRLGPDVRVATRLLAQAEPTSTEERA